MPSKDMTGMKFGRLSVIEEAGRDKFGNTTWKCRCDCGNIVVLVGYQIRSGHTQSCGCLHIESTSKLNKSHGGARTPLYIKWVSIKSRCNNPKSVEYKSYGGRGITICKEWESDFDCFKKWALQNGYSPGMTIERIDVNKGYNPENCCWIPANEQARNTRRTVRIPCGDSYMTAQEVARLTNRHPQSIIDWFRTGQIKSVDDAIAKSNKTKRLKRKEEIKDAEQNCPDGQIDP